MRANWITMAATAAAANTNSVQLTAVSNLPTFADAFGTSGSRQVEYEMDDGAGHFECGIGSVNLATLVLTKGFILNTFDAGASTKWVDGGTTGLTSFAGAVSVRCAPLAGAVPGGESFHYSGSPGIGNGYHTSRIDQAATTGLQGWRNFMPFLWTGERPITSVSINVTGVATSATTLRLGIMEITGANTCRLIKEFTANTRFNLATSGVQTISDFGKLYLPQGPYVIQFSPYGNGGGILAAAANYWSERGLMFGRQSDWRIQNATLQDVNQDNLLTSFTGPGNGGFATYSAPPIFSFGTT